MLLEGRLLAVAQHKVVRLSGVLCDGAAMLSFMGQVKEGMMNEKSSGTVAGPLCCPPCQPAACPPLPAPPWPHLQAVQL